MSNHMSSGTARVRAAAAPPSASEKVITGLRPILIHNKTNTWL